MGATEAVLGALYRTDADCITGWCWRPSNPLEQCCVEVLIDGKIERWLRASRRFEGAARNGPPHDQFGFLLSLPPRAGKRWHRIEAREQRTGVVFGRLMEAGEDPGLPLIGQRIDRLRAEATGIAVLEPSVDLAGMLRAIGDGLRGNGFAPLDVTSPPRPRVSLVVIGCERAETAYRAIAALRGQAADLAAEILLAGDLMNRDLASLTSFVRGLRLIDGTVGAALDAAAGEFLLVVDGGKLRAVPDLASFLGDQVALPPDADGAVLGMRRADWRSMTGSEATNMAQFARDIALEAGLLGLRC